MLDVAERGRHVFPLRPGTKRPTLHGEAACPGTGGTVVRTVDGRLTATRDDDTAAP
ncbi:hypothetical protein ACFZCU_11250 [Streptomyces canus]|uniref:hypothetical protein n=1 Tax=Streptomyces canus TaxID=58343 RepID=UPI0036E36640